MAAKYVFCFNCSFALTVHFRYVVFRPFMDEIVAGKIRSSSKEGVHGEYKHLLDSLKYNSNCKSSVPV